MPDAHREPVFAFVRGNVCSKTEIGLKATGNGMIAITNWHLLNDSDTVEDVEEIEALGAPPNPQQVISAVLPLKLKAERDESGNTALSEGQRVMLRAGLKKLRKLEADFARIDMKRHPKMLVVCEDTTVSPLVAAFLQDQERLPACHRQRADAARGL